MARAFPSRRRIAVELPEPQSDGDELGFLAVGRAVDRPRGHLGPAHHAPALGRADQGSHRALLGELRLAVWPRSDRRHGVPAPWLEEITSALAALAAPAAEDTRPLAA